MRLLWAVLPAVFLVSGQAAADHWTMRTKFIVEKSMVARANGGMQEMVYAFDLDGDVLHFSNEINAGGWSARLDPSGDVNTVFTSSSGTGFTLSDKTRVPFTLTGNAKTRSLHLASHARNCVYDLVP